MGVQAVDVSAVLDVERFSQGLPVSHRNLLRYVQRQADHTTSASTPTKPSKPKAPRNKHKRGSSGAHPRNSNSNPNPTSSSASTSSEVEEELAATPLPRHREKYAMTRGLSPFWRTPRGYAILGLIVLVIILAIVGAAVGGSIANREAQKVDEREAAASSAAAESSASLAAALTQATHSEDHTTASIEERDFAPQYTYATTANTRHYVPRQTGNPWPAQTTVLIRGRKPPARGPAN